MLMACEAHVQSSTVKYDRQYHNSLQEPSLSRGITYQDEPSCTLCIGTIILRHSLHAFFAMYSKSIPMPLLASFAATRTYKLLH